MRNFQIVFCFISMTLIKKIKEMKETKKEKEGFYLYD
jgi:hypothetical protein